MKKLAFLLILFILLGAAAWGQTPPVTYTWGGLGTPISPSDGSEWNWFYYWDNTDTKPIGSWLISGAQTDEAPGEVENNDVAIFIDNDVTNQYGINLRQSRVDGSRYFVPLGELQILSTRVDLALRVWEFYDYPDLDINTLTLNGTLNIRCLDDGDALDPTRKDVNIQNLIIGSDGYFNSDNANLRMNGALVEIEDAPNGDITITAPAGQNLIVGSIDAPDRVVTLDAPSGNITINGNINCARLIIDAPNGTVTIPGSVSITADDEDECDDSGCSDTDCSIFIEANHLNAPLGSGSTACSGTSHLLLTTYNPDLRFPSANTVFHGTSTQTTGHIVYGTLTPSDNIPSPYTVYDPSDNLGASLTLKTDAGYNIYVINVPDSAPANTRNLNLENDDSADHIEFRGNYKSSGTLTLAPGTGGVLLNNANIELTGASNVFDSNSDITLSGTANSIKASVIELGAITGNSSNLTLDGTAAIDGGSGINTLTISGSTTVTGSALSVAILNINTGASLALGANDLTATTTINNAGTIYLDGSQTVIPAAVGGTVDFNVAGTNFAGITSFENIIISAGTRTTTANLIVSGNWSVTGTATFTASAGTVTFSGANTSVSGNNTFNDLAVAGIVSFAGNSTQTIKGILSAAGATLTSASAHWNLVTPVGWTYLDSSTTFIWCSSDRYLKWTDDNEANDGGNNLRVFSGGTFTWQNNAGPNNTNWENDANWDLGYFPDPKDNTTIIIIPNTANKLVLEVPVECDELTIQLSAEVTLGAFNLTVATINNSGTLKLNDTGTLITSQTSIGGTVEFSGTGTTIPNIPNYNDVTILSGGRTASGALTITGNLEIETGAVIDLAEHTLTITQANGLTNAGTIMLHGEPNQVTVNSAAPSSPASGTIHYYGTASGGNNNWVFGDSYTNLIVANTAAMIKADALIVSANATFDSSFSAVSVAVTGVTTIDYNITISADTDLTFTGAITGTGSLSLNAGNDIVINGTIGASGTPFSSITISNGNAAFNNFVYAGTITNNGTLSFGVNDVSVTNLTNNNTGTLNANAASKIILTGGTWNNSGNYTPNGGTVEFNGTVTVNGSNHFNVLNITSGSVIRFENDKTQTVEELFADNATLEAVSSGTAGSFWHLDIDPDNLNLSSLPNLSTIKDCSSVNSLDLINGEDAIDGNGNNFNVFLNNVFIWIGATDRDWDTQTNWIANNIPVNANDSIVIIRAGSFYPELNVDLECGSMTVQNGARIDLGGNSLTVAKPAGLTNNGTIMLHGAATQSVEVNGSTATGTSVGGTINYHGSVTDAQWVFGGSYKNLIVDAVDMDTAGALTVSDTANINANITTTNNQNYSGKLTIGGGATVTLTSTSGSIILENDLELNANADLAFGGTVNANGIELSATSSNVTFNNSLVITGSNEFSSANGNISFNSVSGTVTGSGNLELSATGSGNVIFNGNYSTTGELTFGAGGGSIRLNNSAINLNAANSIFNTNGNTLELIGTSNSITAVEIILNNVTGNNNNLSLNASNIILNGNISSTGTLNANGNLTLGGTGTRTIGATNVNLLNTVTGNSRSLTITATNIAINDDISGVNALVINGLLELGGTGATRTIDATSVSLGDVDGDSDNNGTADKSLTINAPSITFRENISDVVTLTVNGTVKFSGTTGQIFILSPQTLNLYNVDGENNYSLTINTANTFLNGDIVDINTLNVNNQLTLGGIGAIRAIDANEIHLNSITGANNSLTISAGTKTVLNDNVIGVNTLIANGLLELGAGINISAATVNLDNTDGDGQDLTITATNTVIKDDIGNFGNLTINGLLELDGAGLSRSVGALQIVNLNAVNGNGKSFTVNAGTMTNFNGAVNNVNNLSVSGPAALNANITTTGNQIFNGDLTLSELRTLSAGGTFTTGTGNISAVNGITINADGVITIGAGGINQSTITTGNISLTSKQNVNINGNIYGGQLVIITDADVNIGAFTLKTASTGNEGPNAAIYIKADSFAPNALSEIIPGGAGGQLCLVLNSSWNDDDTDGSFIVDGPEEPALNARWHQHVPKIITGHLVYGFVDPVTFTDDDGNFIDTSSNAEFISVASFDRAYNVTGTNNIYIIDAGTVTHELQFKTDGGFIEIRGTFTSDYNLALLAGAAGVGNIRLKDANITLNGADFKTNSSPLHILDKDISSVISSDNTVKASNIIIDNGIVSRDTPNNLTLDATAAITITGAVGTTTNYLGDIIVTKGNINFSASSSVFAKSYKQNAGSLTLSAAQTYDETFTNTGTSALSENITANDGIGFGGAVSLNNAVTLATTNNDITFGANVIGNSDLTINAGTGDVLFSGQVGVDETDHIGNLVVSNAGSVNFTHDVFAAAVNINNSVPAAIKGNITTTGTQTYTGIITLGLPAAPASSHTLKGGGLITINQITGNNNSLTIDGTSTHGNNIINIENFTATGLITGPAAGLEINANGDITVAAVTTTGTLKLTSVKNIIINGNINAANLILSANQSSGLITINNNSNIMVTGPVLTGVPCPFSNTDITVFISAFNLNSTYLGTISLPAGTCVCCAGSFTINSSKISGGSLCDHEVKTIKIIYSFAEDANGNGKLDRIRVQTSESINTSGGLGNFAANVEGYSVESYGSIPGHNDLFYININEEEHHTLYDGKYITWRVTNPEINGNPIDLTDGSVFHTINTIPPRVSYTLTLPGHNETFIQMSQKVGPNDDPLVSSSAAINSVPPPVSGFNSWYLIPSGPFTVAELEGNPSVDFAPTTTALFTMKGFWSSKEIDEEKFTLVPGHSPKYPTDWNYSNYSAISTSVFKPPFRVLTPQMMKTLSTSGSVTPGNFSNDGEFKRRSTDVLVSITDENENYFAWPIWAKAFDDDSKTIWSFDGSSNLEAKTKIDLQARINSQLGSISDLELFWTDNAGINYRNPKEAPSRGKGSGGLWLPLDPSKPAPFYYFVPMYEGASGPHSVSSSNQLFEITAPNEFKNSDKFEFIFRIQNREMFIARLDIKRGQAIPADWYRHLSPFSFDILSLRQQRGGVTIMNNVINSDKREKTYLMYHLVRPGRVTIQVYTLDGSLVKSIRRNEQCTEGEWTDTWDGTNNSGRSVARGMYFIRIVAPDIDEIRKVMVVK